MHVNELALARKIAIEKRKEQEEQRLLQAEELEHAKRLQIARQNEAAEEDRRRADRSAPPTGPQTAETLARAASAGRPVPAQRDWP